MKRISTLTLALILTVAAFTQDNVKTGWNVGPLPAVSFSTDLGFQYGAIINLFDYGDGDNYPGYDHSLFFEVSRFTKGSGTSRFMYDSEHLIPGIGITSDISYLTDEAYDFYGFNGYESVYNSGWDDSESDDYRTRMFYKTKRTLFRFKNDFRGRIGDNNLFWNAGITIKSFNISSVDIEKLNEGKDTEDLLPIDEDGLYDLYNQWDIFDQDELDGGLITTLKAGISYDSRDNKANAMKGIWFETGIEASPSFLSENGFARFYAIHRQYFTIVPEDLNFAYRIGYQSTIAGDVPFYYQNQIITSVLAGTTSEGLGGSKNVRGVLRNRIVGDGLLYGNLELRWKFIRFSLLNQNIYLGLVGFSDFGMVTKNVDFTLPTLADMPSGYTHVVADYFTPDEESLHISAGLGLRIVMNENFVLAIDYGKAFNDQDGNSGFYIGLNYLF